MNRILFDTLTFLNGFIALTIIAVSTLVGWNHPLFAAAKPIGAVLGGVFGLTAAAVICGTLAFFALMERHMRTIAERGPVPRVHPSDRLFVSDDRQEPRL
jgi:hypothetical protein